MCQSIFTVKNVDESREKRITRLLLEELRMLMDWQLRQLGYSPESVNAACRKADGED